VRTAISIRWCARLAALGTGALLPVLLAAPALALDDGEVKGKSLGAGLVAFFSVLPSMLRRPRYRPGRPWPYDPLWFRGPDDPEQALAGARPRATAKGGASAEW
jgi:hypothetical protein